MSARLLTRQIVTFVLALGIFLGGTAPIMAMPDMTGKGAMPGGMAMKMPGMAMQNACAPDRGMPTKNTPCKNSDGSCTVCTACAVPAVLTQHISLVRLLVRSHETVFLRDVNRNGVAVLPALPPPILQA